MSLSEEFSVARMTIDELYERRLVEINTGLDVATNDYLLFTSEENPKHTCLARHRGNQRWSPIPSRTPTLQGITPRDRYQRSFVDSLDDSNILLSVATGSAGTGKTTLAMAYALTRHVTDSSKIVLAKPTSTVGRGRAFGPVPGDIGEKYAPYLASYDIILKKLCGGDRGAPYVETMKSKGHLEFVPVELARGCTFDNATFILDEAQNLSWHELNTIISRMGEKTKMIVLGDLYQIDERMRAHETGLYKLLHAPAFRNSEISSSIGLQTQYRSPITQLVADVDRWIRHT